MVNRLTNLQARFSVVPMKTALIRIRKPDWVALKVASVHLDTSILKVLALLCQGDTVALAAVQRAMREEEE